MIAISGTQYDCAKWLHVFGVVLIINNTQLPQAVMEEGFKHESSLLRWASLFTAPSSKVSPSASSPL
jgi:hypothetical protein